MSSSHFEGQAATRAARNIIRQATAALTGKERGRDRQVHRNSYDVEDQRAKPWLPIGDGTAGAGIAFREALAQTAEELSIQDTKMTRRLELAVRDASDPRSHDQALRALAEHRHGAIGRPDVFVIRALLGTLDFATGRLFPSLQTIADRAGVSLRRVITGLAKLKARGFIDWVRRSIATDNDGQFAPQREQTSNAYFFRHNRESMGKGVFGRFLQLLQAKRKRLGGKSPPAPTRPPRELTGEIATLFGRMEATIFSDQSPLSASA